MKAKLTKKQQEALTLIEDNADELGWADVKIHKRVLTQLIMRKYVETDFLYSKIRSLHKRPANLVVAFKEQHSGGRVCAGDEDSDWPSHEDENRVQDFIGIVTSSSLIPNGYHSEEKLEVGFTPILGMELFLVIVNYDTGDTFGRSCGHISMPGIYDTKEKAEEVATAISNKTYDGYKDWDGYFEVFNFVEVQSFKLNDIPYEFKLKRKW